MWGTFFSPKGKAQRRWLIITVALVIAEIVLSLTLKRGSRALNAYYEISFIVLILLACGVAIWNLVQNRHTIRLFWSFLAVSFGVWVLVSCTWFYFSGLHGKAPDFFFLTFPSFLHIVLMIAAVASRPHLEIPSRRPYRTTLNFFVLLSVWVLAYAYFVFPYEYLPQSSKVILRFETFYLTENLFLLVFLSILALRSTPPWKSMYWHLFGASALYAVGSLARNVAWASGSLDESATGIPFTLVISWFMWIGLQGHRLKTRLAQTVQLDTTDPKYSSAFAMLAVFAVPLVGLHEVLRTGDPLRTHEIRLLLLMIAFLLLAIALFIRDYLANREFASDVGETHDRLRLAMESGKSVGWEWDVASGQSLRFGDLQTMFGISSDIDIGTFEDFLRSVHPDDRSAFEKAVADATLNRQLYAVEFRVVWPDGTVRWATARGRCYYGVNGEPQRVFGMAVDITERKTAEDSIRESEERFRLVANTAPVLIWMSGVDKLCTYFNKPWLEFTGESLDSQLGSGWARGVHPDDLPQCLRTYTEAFDRRGQFRMEYRLRRHDKQYRWMVDHGVPRFSPDRSFAGYIGSCIDVTERKLAEETLSCVSRRLIEAQEQERSRIARELHDDINQRLALLSIDIEEVTRLVLDSGAEVKVRLQQIAKRTVDINKDVHAISHRLHSSQLEYLGIAAAAASFCRELSEQKKVEIDFSQNGRWKTVSQETSLCLFRVLQEALNNAVKYSGVRHFMVQLSGTGDEISLAVRDFGKGFDVEAAMNGRGLGLISMRERVSLVKGSISISSKLMDGTEIRVRVPLDAGESANQVSLPA